MEFLDQILNDGSKLPQILIMPAYSGSHILVQYGTKDPRYAQVLGFARTLRSEKQTSFTTLEIDNVANPTSPDKAVLIYEQIERPDHDPELDPDYEFTLFEGTIYSSRYHWLSVRDELASAAEKVVYK